MSREAEEKNFKESPRAAYLQGVIHRAKYGFIHLGDSEVEIDDEGVSIQVRYNFPVTEEAPPVAVADEKPRPQAVALTPKEIAALDAPVEAEVAVEEEIEEE